MANIYFNVADEENLIELVHHYPALYNSQSANYKNFSAKAYAWKEIGEKINKTEDACKAKWKHIRDWYIRKKKAGKFPKGSGTFSSHLCLRFEKLGFVTDSEKTMEISNFSETIKEEQTTTSKDDSNLTSEGNESESPVLELIKSPKVLKFRIPKRKLRQILPKTSKRRFEEIRGEVKKRRIQERDEKEPTQCVSLPTLKHPIDEFFGAMASIVKQLPANIQVQVKQEVSRIVLLAESRVVSRQDTSFQLNDNSNISSNSSNSSQGDGTIFTMEKF